jgi:hypothetical protein
MSFAWTQEAESALRGMCADGLAYSTISNEISAQFKAFVSRNACIGKAKRLGISETKPAATVRQPGVRRARSGSERKRRQAKPRSNGFVFGPGNGVPRDPGITDLPPDASVFSVTIEALTESQCRWPLGEPSAKMLYCGAPAETVPGRGPDGEPRTLPYCTRHCRIAYVRPGAPACGASP